LPGQLGGTDRARSCQLVARSGEQLHGLDQTEKDRTARTLSAWSISSSTTIAVFTALWGVLASLTSPRTAIAIAGVLILATPFLLPRPRRRRSRSLSEPAVIPNPLA
jgi:hypothetical protein